MSYSSIYKYGTVTKSQMVQLSGMTTGDNCFCTDWNMEVIYNGQFWLASNMVVLINTAGVTVTENEVLVAVSTADMNVTRSSTFPNKLMIGVVVYPAVNGANVVLQTRGITTCKSS